MIHIENLTVKISKITVSYFKQKKTVFICLMLEIFIFQFIYQRADFISQLKETEHSFIILTNLCMTSRRAKANVIASLSKSIEFNNCKQTPGVD